MIRRPPRSTQSRSSAASDVYKRQVSTQSTWGKAIIKVSIQTIFIIVVFSKKHAESLVKSIEGLFPSLGNSLTSFMENWKKQFFNPPSDLDNKHWIASLWEIIVTLMIVYFVISCVTSLAQTYASRLQQTIKDNNSTNKTKSD
eukprot:TRINITY_DN3105_c0_g4_i8.p1 TRINITY_DN3105_c0_g4~~TRINITY_DN3105_c0_g4_i8.p1  ORF type:complete len:151 (-),score=18.13 TRINITY_DN3105_c0_g4_i8:149-577(-)